MALVTCLWLTNQAEEAARFYVETLSLCGFQTELITDPAATTKPMAYEFKLLGSRFITLNGRPDTIGTFTSATSFMLNCQSQAQIDETWAKLTANGGKEGRCGWLTDKFGVSWQVLPENLPQLLRGAGAVGAMMKMNKLDIATLASCGSSSN